MTLDDIISGIDPATNIPGSAVIAMLRMTQRLTLAAIPPAPVAVVAPEPEHKPRRKSRHEWTPEQRAAAGDRLRQRQAAKAARLREGAAQTGETFPGVQSGSLAGAEESVDHHVPAAGADAGGEAA
jgi:hypothetical protein